jgi:ADP-ribosylation factor-like protein 2
MEIVLIVADPDRDPWVAQLLPDPKAFSEILPQLLENARIFRDTDTYNSEIPTSLGLVILQGFPLLDERSPIGLTKILLAIRLPNEESSQIGHLILRVAMKWFIDDLDISKAFGDSMYNNTATIHQQRLKQHLSEIESVLYAHRDKLEVSLSQIVFLGIQSVGKTAIINRLSQGDFPTVQRPTLAPQMLKIIYEQINLRVFDVGGQKKLRDSWKTVCKNPDAIVYITDVTLQGSNLQESIDMFSGMMMHYFTPKDQPKLPLSTPVVILANKIDIKPDFHWTSLENMLQPQQYGMPYWIGIASARTGEGLTDAFGWLVNQLQTRELLKKD